MAMILENMAVWGDSLAVRKRKTLGKYSLMQLLLPPIRHTLAIIITHNCTKSNKVRRKDIEFI